MGKHKLKCPYCCETYDISTYSIGQSDICELRCDSCSRTLSLHIYDPCFMKLYAKHGSYNEIFNKELESMLNPCQCGGTFRLEAPYRCKICKKIIDISEIKRQISFVGTPDGKPGLIITGEASVKNVWRISDKI